MVLKQHPDPGKHFVHEWGRHAFFRHVASVFVSGAAEGNKRGPHALAGLRECIAAWGSTLDHLGVQDMRLVGGGGGGGACLCCTAQARPHSGRHAGV